MLMCSLFYRKIQQFTENNPYKISASNTVILYGIYESLPSIYYELLVEPIKELLVELDYMGCGGLSIGR